MRRAFRHGFTLISAISLLLCVAMCVLWVRSYRTEDMFGVHGSQRIDGFYASVFYYAATRAGGVRFAREVYPLEGGEKLGFSEPSPIRLEWETDPTNDDAGGHDMRWLGFASVRYVHMNTDQAWIEVPMWALLAAASLPLVVFRTPAVIKRRARRYRGLCAACGYDLRAHAIGRRCPECGAAITESRLRQYCPKA